MATLDFSFTNSDFVLSTMGVGAFLHRSSSEHMDRTFGIQPYIGLPVDTLREYL